MHLYDLIEEKARTDASWAQAHALMRLADEAGKIAAALRALGNADASTPMGAMEALGDTIYRAGEEITSALDAIADKLPSQD